jgi:hypothetical protein
MTIHLCIYSINSDTCRRCLDYKAVWDPEQVSTLQGQQNFLPLSVTERRFLGLPTFSQVTILTELSLPPNMFLFSVPYINQVKSNRMIFMELNAAEMKPISLYHSLLVLSAFYKHTLIESLCSVPPCCKNGTAFWKSPISQEKSYDCLYTVAS